MNVTVKVLQAQLSTQKICSAVYKKLRTQRQMFMVIDKVIIEFKDTQIRIVQIIHIKLKGNLSVVYELFCRACQ